MWRVLFLILVLMSSIAFAQVPINSKPEAKKVNEFGKVYNEDIEEGLDLLAISLQKEPKAAGHIITYGSEREIARRERLIRNHLDLRKFDISRIIFVKGGFVKEVKSEFWVVPEGAKPPNVSKDEKTDLPKAAKFEEFGPVSNGELRYYTDKFFLELANNPDARGYIINYGKTKLVLNRERVLWGRINLRRIPAARIKFIRGGNKKEFTTELWIVPQGAKPPTP